MYLRVAGAASCQREHCHCYEGGVKLATIFHLTDLFLRVHLALPGKVGVKRSYTRLSERSRIQRSQHITYPRRAKVTLGYCYFGRVLVLKLLFPQQVK